MVLLFVYRLLTKHRRSLVNDEVFERTVTRTSEANRDLDHSLARAGVDTTSLITGAAGADQQVRDDLAKLLATMAVLREQTLRDAVSQDAELNVAKALMAERRWAEAAEYFDRYVRRVDADWEVHFARGVAHANSRGGASSDLAALRAVSEAVALAPADAKTNFVARLFSYRGAMAKRLGRLDQAEADLLLARRRATAKYETTDIAYNLAGIYALAGRTTEALAELRQLRNLGGIELVRGHLDDYFRTLRENPEFQQITGLSPA